MTSEEQIEKIINQILKKDVNSQGLLKKLVNEKLKLNKKLISERKLRTICLKIPDIKIITHVKHGNVPKKCPCCFSDLEIIYTKNLLGKNVLSKLRCKKCGYFGRNKKWTPMRYVFRKIC